jgi:ATP-dependent DNA ligase
VKPKAPGDSCLTQRALIDGEAVVFRDDGRSTFVALLTKGGGARASLVAFDLLRLNGEDLARRGRPTKINVLREAVCAR